MEGFGLLIVVALVYFLPTLVAWNRHVPSAGSVFVLNLFLGWTLIGWVVALAMASRTVPEAHLELVQARRVAKQQAKQAHKQDWEQARPSWWR